MHIIYYAKLCKQDAFTVLPSFQKLEQLVCLV